MLALYDVWVNWFDGAENGYDVPLFHEWRKDDGIELLDQTPLLYVDDKTFDYVLNSLEVMPRKMLEMIEDETYVKKNQVRHSIKYAAALTNGKTTFLFDCLGYDLPVKKSRLIPRQERTSLEMIDKFEPLTFELEGEEKVHHHLSLDPMYMTGLTRRERQLKSLLMMAIDQLKLADHPEESKYWLTEFRPDLYNEVKDMDSNQAWNKLLNLTMNGWSDSHQNLCGKLTENQPFLKTIWDDEMKPVKKS
ncbi:DUF3603 family protein [Halobacillus litoralis]|uniref:DUF3603 family protein n=1 Tax=Halobacillus litoralis TaxID=45668 RepID=UPI001CD6CF05|nr:DUF3603 family protein [Halobacillus litoralis]MCA1021567.1 YjbA family protein [Halobacillus litoralis]